MIQTAGELREALKDYADDVAISTHLEAPFKNGNLELTHKIERVEVSRFKRPQLEVTILQLD